jgi:hypothetical protein
MAPRVNFEPPVEYPYDNDVDDHGETRMSVGIEYFRAAYEVLFPTITHSIHVSTKLCWSIALVY